MQESSRVAGAESDPEFLMNLVILHNEVAQLNSFVLDPNAPSPIDALLLGPVDLLLLLDTVRVSQVTDRHTGSHMITRDSFLELGHKWLARYAEGADGGDGSGGVGATPNGGCTVQ